jgi:nucleoside-diphosphate-sugar epimerase
VEHWVIVGCGYVGMALARRLLVDQHGYVYVTRRDATAAEVAADELEREVDSAATVVGIGLDLGSDGDRHHLSMPTGWRTTVVCCAPPGADPAREIADLLAFTDAHRLIYVSSTGVYAPGGGAWVDETWPLEPATTSGKARLAAERALPPTAIALRCAGIWGPGRGLVDRLRAGTYRIVGDGRAHVSRIHVDDVVEAIVRAAATDITGAVNVADDDPAPIGEVADTLAAELGLPPPPRVPVGSVDAEIAGMLTADRRIANARMKHELGVVLRYPSWRAAL